MMHFFSLPPKTAGKKTPKPAPKDTPTTPPPPAAEPDYTSKAKGVAPKAPMG